MNNEYVSKIKSQKSNRKNVLTVFITLSLAFAFFVPQSFASGSGRQAVLGMVVEDKPSIPPTVEGPGFLLPDSPFYFLDILKQQARILFSVTAEQKAQTYESIAGERLAEARFELIKNNTDAAYIALQGVRLNTKKAAEEVKNAQDMGRNVNKLAGDINSSIKSHQDALDFLQAHSTGELRADVAVVQAALADAKAVVENGLPQELLLQEVHEDLLRQAAHSASDTEDAALMLKSSLDILQQQATDAAKYNLKDRQIALDKAIAEKNQELAKVSAASMLEQKRKDDLSAALQAKADTDTETIVEKAEAVANTVKTAQDVTGTQKTGN